MLLIVSYICSGYLVDSEYASCAVHLSSSRHIRDTGMAELGVHETKGFAKVFLSIHILL